MATVFCLVWLLPSLCGELPSNPVKVGKVTTFITEPLASDGLPNFALAILEQQRKGFVREQNGAIPFWEALGQGDLEDNEFEHLSSEIGLNQESKVAKLVELHGEVNREAVIEWLAVSKRPTDEDEAIRISDEYLDWVQRNPWTKETVPPLADWPMKNEQAINLLVDASTKPQFYSPYANVLVDRSTPVLVINLEHAQRMRTAARALMARSMFYLGNEDLERAWSDCKACIRLGNHLAQAPILVEQLVAIALRGLDMKGAQIILSRPDLTPELAQKILSDFVQLERAIDMPSALNFSERLSSLDYMLRLLTDRLGGMPDEEGMKEHSLDLDITLQYVNERFNRVGTAARIDYRGERVKQLKLLDEEFTEEFKNQKSFILPGLFSKAVRSKNIGQIFFAVGCPAFQAAFSAVDRDKQCFELTRIAAALAVYKTQKGQYPQTLGELSPSILTEIPFNLYTEKPLQYRRMIEGYLLYSVFENGIDDGGNDLEGEIQQGEWSADEAEIDTVNCDLVIRIPVPNQPIP